MGLIDFLIYFIVVTVVGLCVVNIITTLGDDDV
jgi:hypothetical protein